MRSHLPRLHVHLFTFTSEITCQPPPPPPPVSPPQTFTYTIKTVSDSYALPAIPDGPDE